MAYVGTVLVAAAVCPHPPLLIPGVTAGAAPETDALRAACDATVGELVAAEPDVIALIGTGPEASAFGAGAWGTFAGYGVDVRAGLPGADTSDPVLPLALTVGAWLLARSSYAGESQAWSVPADLPSSEAAALGVEIAGCAPRVGLLVLGDGSARRSVAAPGYLDDRAGPFDAGVATALTTVDLDALLDLDVGLADELLAVGRAPWQVLAGAAWGRDWRSDLTYDDAPYGVGYLVASWQLA